MEPFQKIQLAFKCPKAFGELQPCTGGWHCSDCQKIVHDFRGMTEAQILDAFRNSGQTLCGMYDAGSIRVIPQKVKWYRWAPAALLALIGLTSCQKTILGEPRYQNKNMEQAAGMNAPAQDTLFGVVLEINPSFPGGEAAFTKYILQHVKYSGGYKGRVFVQFVVERDGSLSDIKVVKGSDNELNEQLISVIAKAPKWKPGIQNGKPNRVQFTVPFSFSPAE
jgi:TonB family protein